MAKRVAKTAKKRVASAARSKKSSAAAVTVRMFCQGLGDCFLVTIPQGGKRDYSILIDCGVAMGTPGRDKIMPAVVAKIDELTGGIVDVLVVTHEHLDHVSGFAQAEQQFEQIEFKNIWFAWTENGRDKLAQELRRAYGKAKLALQRIRANLAASNGQPGLMARRLAAIDGVLAFHGIEGAALAAANGKKRLGDVERAMENLRRWARELADDGGRQYLLPGQSRKLPGAAADSLAGQVQAHVLGPPHDRAKVIRINPSKSHSETYEKQKHLAAAGVDWSWSSAVMGLAADGSEVDPQDAADYERSLPFDQQWRIPWKDAPQWKGADGRTFFDERYFADAPENAGRRIDDDWLWSGAQRLALHLESYTNNTSLVLALELPRTNKVLLFAADAQVGNWLSWHDHSYTSTDGQPINAEQLLAQTVLYKVGHHGSHNATLRERGLELMTHPELIALLSVEVEAVQRLGYGEMPLVSLIAALHDRCEGRILQLDAEWPRGKAPGEWHGLQPATASKETILAGKNGQKRPLYHECTIRD